MWVPWVQVELLVEPGLKFQRRGIRVKNGMGLSTSPAGLPGSGWQGMGAEGLEPAGSHSAAGGRRGQDPSPTPRLGVLLRPLPGQGTSGTVTTNPSMAGVGRALCGSPSPTLPPKLGHPEQAAQHRGQARRIP